MTRGSNKKSGARDPFPVRLYDMMAFAESECLESATICWVLGGRGFIVNNSDKLVEILSLFFASAKYKSFLRQLNMWDFERISHGPHKGTYMHPYFVKGNRELCFQICRQIKPATKKHESGSTSRRVPQDEQRQPLFMVDKGPGSVKSDIAGSCQHLLTPPIDLLDHHPRQQVGEAAQEIGHTKQQCHPQITAKQIMREKTFHEALTFSGLLCNYESSPLEPSPIASPMRSTRMSCISTSTSSSSSNTSTISTIGEILEDYAYLFETEGDVEEDSEMMKQSPPVPSMSPSGSSSRVVSSEDSDRYDILVESLFPIGEKVQRADFSCFAGKNFFLVDEDHHQ